MHDSRGRSVFGARLLNVSLKGATLASRFLFVFFLARYLEPAFIGLYGLFVAAISYAIYFVGLDFYTYTTRELPKFLPAKRGMLLKSQAALSVILYGLFLPVGWCLFQSGLLPPELLIWFISLLVLEHVNQELSRLLIAVSRQVAASVVLFIRQGSWTLIVVACMAAQPSTRTLEFVLACWIGADIAAVIFGAYCLACLNWGGWREKIDWSWVMRGIKTSLFFLVATLALRAIQTFDRYWLDSLAGTDMVGAYVLFGAMAGTLMGFLDAGVFSFAYPKLISLNQTGQGEAFRQHAKKMLINTSVICLLFALVSMGLLPIALEWIANPFYMLHAYLYPWLLSAMIINAFSMVPHYVLYATGRDRPIIYSHGAGLIAFVSAAWLISLYDDALAIPIGLNVAFGSILIWKVLALKIGKFVCHGAFSKKELT